MKKYHKIQSIFKRDMSNAGKFILGHYSIPEYEYLKDTKWIFTEKIDGTNIRIMFDGNIIKFGGKSDNSSIPVLLYDKLYEIFNNKLELFKELFKNDLDDKIKVCLYGEGYGATIQKGGGKYISDGVDFILFDIKIGHMWLRREDIKDIANQLNLKIVDVVGEGTLNDGIKLVTDELQSTFGNFIAEGIVARPSVELHDRRGYRIITKIKYKDFIK